MPSGHGKGDRRECTADSNVQEVPDTKEATYFRSAVFEMIAVGTETNMFVINICTVVLDIL